ncbi:MAG: insulinase family protein [Nitrospirales bacterium]|nr:insulinase family protein [Nitrospira sp.]MDR4502660.1 insulinase family protein [Nitrospirales bacterium]
MGKHPSRVSRLTSTVLLLLLSHLWLIGPLYAQVEYVADLRFPPLPDLAIPEPTRVTLDNGMVILMMEDHELPLVSVSAKIRTGSRLDPPGKVGLAQIVGSVMRSGGTTTMSGDALDDYLEGKAATIETSIGETMGSASMSCLKDDFVDILKVFADVLRNPSFNQEKLAIAKNQAMASISRQNDNPDSIVSREFKKLVYGADSSYARTPTYTTISAITQTDLKDWHQRFFHPNRMIIGITGDFQADAALTLLKKVFSDWPAGPPVQPVSVPYAASNPANVFYVEKNDMTQAKIIMGHLGVLRNNPDYYPLVVVNQILSGSFGARLFSNVRSKQGLAYDVHGGVGFQWDYPGMASLMMSTKTETTAAGIDALIAESQKMVSEPPTDEEVAKAKASIINSFVFSVDSPAKVLGQYLLYEYYGYPLDWLVKFRDGIEQVTTEQVREAAQHHLRPLDFSILVVGPRAGTAPALARYDAVQELDISIPEPS